MKLLFWLLVGLSVWSVAAAQELSGQWHGELELPGTPLAVGLSFSQTPGGLRGTIDIPAQGVNELPLTDLTQKGKSVMFGLQGIPGDPRFDGKLSASGERAKLAGTFSQSGQSFPFTLTRGPLQAATRPQEPKPPFPYRREDVTVEHGSVTLAGTLTLPQGRGPFTAVQLITGSGAQDRDETIAGHKPFLLLADTLTRAGYAVLRFDDRGVGGSTGDLAKASYDDLTGDVLAGIAYLKSRADINPERIGLLGHSEGGYLAPLAAKRSPDIAFVILMAGPAVSGEKVLVLQNRLILKSLGRPEAQIEAQVKYIKELSARLEEKDYRAARALARQQIKAQFSELPAAQRPSPAAQTQTIRAYLASLPSLRGFLVYDPKAALAALRMPVFAFYGSKDVQVPASQNAPVMRKLLGNDPDATVRVFPGLNHLMQPAQTGAVSEYAQIETTVAPVVLETLVKWLGARF